MARRSRIKDVSNDDPDRVRIDDKGREVLDTTPVTLPVRFRRGENISDQVQRLVAMELSKRAAAEGYETFDEANDFDVGDDYDPRSEHEIDEVAEDAFYDRYNNERRFEVSQGVVRKRTPESPRSVQQSGSQPAQPSEGNAGNQQPSGGDGVKK